MADRRRSLPSPSSRSSRPRPTSRTCSATMYASAPSSNAAGSSSRPTRSRTIRRGRRGCSTTASAAPRARPGHARHRHRRAGRQRHRRPRTHDRPRLDPRLTESLDIVLFDARGVGDSDYVDCPVASDRYQSTLWFDAVAAVIEDFVTACIDETGVDPARLGGVRQRPARRGHRDDPTRPRHRPHRAVRRELRHGRRPALRGRPPGARLSADPRRRRSTSPSRPTRSWIEATRGFDDVLQPDPQRPARRRRLSLPRRIGLGQRPPLARSAGPVSASYADADGAVTGWPLTAELGARHADRRDVRPCRPDADAARLDRRGCRRLGTARPAGLQRRRADSTRRSRPTSPTTRPRAPTGSSTAPTPTPRQYLDAGCGAHRSRHRPPAACTCRALRATPGRCRRRTTPPALSRRPPTSRWSSWPRRATRSRRPPTRQRIFDRYRSIADTYLIETRDGPHVTFGRGCGLPR